MADFTVYVIVLAAVVLILVIVGLGQFNRRFKGKNINPLQNQRPIHVDARFDDIIGEQAGFVNYENGIVRYTLISPHHMEECDGRPEDYVTYPAVNRTVLVHKSIAEAFNPKLEKYRERIQELDDQVEYLIGEVIALKRDPEKRAKDVMQAAEAFVKAKGGAQVGGGFRK